MGKSNVVLYLVFDSTYQFNNNEYVVMANTNYNYFNTEDDSQWSDKFMDDATYGCPQLLMNILCGNIPEAKHKLHDIVAN